MTEGVFAYYYGFERYPFYCLTKGWTEASHLRAGDILVLVNGEYVVVEKVQHELLERPIKVYNFQAEDYHTYYVSGNSSNAGKVYEIIRWLEIK